MNNKFVLITGASKGLGNALAVQYASKKKNLILVSLANEGLLEISQTLAEKYKVSVYFKELDLAINGSVVELAEWVNSNFEVDCLINNAGIGGTSLFSETSAEYIESLIMLNVTALSVLTRLMLPNLKRQERAYILNIASMASFSPMTYKAVYSASKAYVYYFSRALSEELIDSNIFVSVVHPGPMMTNAVVSQSIVKQGVLAKFGGLISTEKTARIAIEKLERRVSFIVPGIVNKINWILMRVVPIKVQLFLGSKISLRELK